MNKGMYRALIGMLCVFTLAFSGCSKAPTQATRWEGVKKPNIIVLMLDTLRADHMSLYGYERDTTPNLLEFSKHASTFENMYAATSWTPSSVASILTGMYAASHLMVPPNSREQAKQQQVRLSPSLETIPELVKKYGYSTAGVTPNPWITKDFGFDQGFERLDYLPREKAGAITSRGIALVDELSKKEQPFFLYLHYFDPHDPYSAPEPYNSMFTGNLSHSPYSYSEAMQQDINRYDGEIRYLDEELGRLLRTLQQRPDFNDMMIFVVADHGEQFLEHGQQTHGFQLYREEVHVPLMVKFGIHDEKSRRVSELASHVDILPTIFDRLGIPVPDIYQGISLLDDAAHKTRKAVLSEVRRKFDEKAITQQNGDRLLLSVPLESKLTFAQSSSLWSAPKVVGLFRPEADPAERAPIDKGSALDHAQKLFSAIWSEAQTLRTSRDPGVDEKDSEISDDTLDQLQSLGYLG